MPFTSEFNIETQQNLEEQEDYYLVIIASNWEYTIQTRRQNNKRFEKIINHPCLIP